MAVGYTSLIILTIAIILLGIFVWIPTAQYYKEIREDEIRWFSSPVYCDIQERLCRNGSLSLKELNMTFLQDDYGQIP